MYVVNRCCLHFVVYLSSSNFFIILQSFISLQLVYALLMYVFVHKSSFKPLIEIFKKN